MCLMTNPTQLEIQLKGLLDDINAAIPNISRRDFFAGIAMHALIFKGDCISNPELLYSSIQWADDLILELDDPREK